MSRPRYALWVRLAVTGARPVLSKESDDLSELQHILPALEMRGYYAHIEDRDKGQPEEEESGRRMD